MGMVVPTRCAAIPRLRCHSIAPGEGILQCRDALSGKSQFQPVSDTPDSADKAESVWLLSSAVRFFRRQSCHRVPDVIRCFNSIDYRNLQSDIQVHRDAWNELGQKTLAHQVQPPTRCGYLINAVRKIRRMRGARKERAQGLPGSLPLRPHPLDADSFKPVSLQRRALLPDDKQATGTQYLNPPWRVSAASTAKHARTED